MRRARRNSLTLVLVAVLLGGWPAAAQRTPRREPPTPASNPASATAQQQMREAEQARATGLAAQRQAAAQAAQAAAAEQRLAAERAAGLVRLRATEDATARIATRVRELAEQENTAEQHLLARSEDLGTLLPLIHRLARYPAETLLAVQPDQGKALRGVLVLRGLAARLEQDAVALRAEQAVLGRAREALGTEQLRLRAAVAAQSVQGAVLDRQIAGAQAARREQEDLAADAARQAAAQAERAENLRAAIAEMEARRRAAEEQARAEAAKAERERRAQDAANARRRQNAFARPSGAGTIAASAQPRGQLVAPVGGPTIRAFGDATPAGPATGITYRPAPRALVVAPCAGKVMFAAPFRSFGLLLIVDCGGLYHGVLAGMERLDVQVGRAVKAGDTVGIMADWDPRADARGGGAARPALYLELRRDGQPINPSPWLGTG